MTSFWPEALCPAKKPWSTNASRLSGGASPLDARLLKDARAGPIRTAKIQPPRSRDRSARHTRPPPPPPPPGGAPPAGGGEARGGGGGFLGGPPPISSHVE